VSTAWALTKGPPDQPLKIATDPSDAPDPAGAIGLRSFDEESTIITRAAQQKAGRKVQRKRLGVVLVGLTEADAGVLGQLARPVPRESLHQLGGSPSWTAMNWAVWRNERQGLSVVHEGAQRDNAHLHAGADAVACFVGRGPPRGLQGVHR